ncbi:MAG: hypothetical protein HY904_00140 [Deltaproteobacteria bacterium]|nr:hypothetical protein [Deltaproteobacteria bacterium]
MTEDSAAAAHPVMRHLARKLCRCVDPRCQTQKVQLDLPERPTGGWGSHWKSNAPEAITLRREIATRLALGHFVLMHVDGECRWSERKESENARHFRERFRDRVRRVLDASGKDPAVLDGLLPVIPHFEMEAWLYQATDTASRLCRDGPCGRHLELFSQWKADRALLDEVEDTKGACCLADRHNEELAKDFPAEEVAAAGTSFAAVVELLRNTPRFMQALARTC